MTDLDDLTERVNDMIAAVRDTPSGERRRKLSVALLKRAAALEEASKAFSRRIEAQWDWCDKNPDHPDFDKREEAIVKNVNRHAALYQSLRSALDSLSQDT